MTTVVNKYKHKPTANDVYIGRGSRWGNPFVIGKHGDRDAVCDSYHARLVKQINAGDLSREDLAMLHGKNLVCYCAPQRCHGDSLKAAAEWAVQQLNESKS